MKWKKISLLQYHDLQIVKNYLEVLEVLNIAAAEQVVDDVYTQITENFCHECFEDYGWCTCVQERNIDKYDRLYDEWKDAQLENED